MHSLLVLQAGRSFNMINVNGRLVDNSFNWSKLEQESNEQTYTHLLTLMQYSRNNLPFMMTNFFIEIFERGVDLFQCSFWIWNVAFTWWSMTWICNTDIYIYIHHWLSWQTDCIGGPHPPGYTPLLPLYTQLWLLGLKGPGLCKEHQARGLAKPIL